MSNHTPGPWFQGNKEGRKKPTVSTKRGGTIAMLAGVSVQTDANARLIAAAPDLLGAVEAFVSYEGNPDFAKWAKIVDNARAAIAKAKGETT